MKKKKRKNINPLKNKKKIINKEINLIGLIIISLLIMLSLFDFNMGIFGKMINKIIFLFFGFGGYFLPIIIIIGGFILILKKFNSENIKLIISLIITFLVFLIIFDRINEPNMKFLERMKNAINLSTLKKGGGLLGGTLGFFFYRIFGTIGTYLILSATIIINILNITNIKLRELVLILKNKIKENITEKNKSRNKKESVKIKIINEKANNTKKENIKILDYATKTSNNNNENIEKVNSVKLNEEEKTFTKYKYPPLDLLKSPIAKENNSEEKEVLENAKIIEETMNNFNIDAKITQINRGPTITCYELEPAPGIKLSKIVSLSDNIALSLASSDIRIEAPIPGKAAVGIEVPNKNKDNVLFKELILSDSYIKLKSKIPLALGKNVSGQSIISTIDKMPHLLIAGATGSGKSVCINTIITSILYKSSPEEVKLLLIDPKIVELSIYNGIPHLLIPVVTDAKKAAFALKWAVDEMEKRYKKFADNNARDITSFNKKVTKKEDKLPMIVIIIDELADLMMVAAQEIEDYICRLAQMARAAGMYLIVATQRPSVDVITGTIKANIPSRISFAVSSSIDSRTILDTSGAEKLLGKGDMLFYPSFYSKPSRLQGAFISDEEVESVVKFLKEQNPANYDENIIKQLDNFKELSLDDTDELLSDAIDLVIDDGQASISMLQRKLKIGHTRASRIVDEMESKGIVGSHQGSKPRKVLVSKNEININ